MKTGRLRVACIVSFGSESCLFPCRECRHSLMEAIVNTARSDDLKQVMPKQIRMQRVSALRVIMRADCASWPVLAELLDQRPERHSDGSAFLGSPLPWNALAGWAQGIRT